MHPIRINIIIININYNYMVPRFLSISGNVNVYSFDLFTNQLLTVFFASDRNSTYDVVRVFRQNEFLPHDEPF